MKEKTRPAEGNRNVIHFGWSNSASRKIYESQWMDDPIALALYKRGDSCLSCRTFGEFDADFGLCYNRESTFFTETVFEHFVCQKFKRRSRNED